MHKYIAIVAGIVAAAALPDLAAAQNINPCPLGNLACPGGSTDVFIANILVRGGKFAFGGVLFAMLVWYGFKLIMINDVTAGRGDPKMFSVVAESNVDYVLMYSKDPTARTTIEEREYDDVIETINIFLSERINEAKAAGIHQSHIIIDPGMGHFVSAKPEYSFEIIDRLSELTPIAPVFISPSRKSFLAGPENLPPSERLPATIKASADAVSNGARYIRTHDVAEIRAGI